MKRELVILASALIITLLPGCYTQLATTDEEQPAASAYRSDDQDSNVVEPRYDRYGYYDDWRYRSRVRVGFRFYYPSWYVHYDPWFYGFTYYDCFDPWFYDPWICGTPVYYPYPYPYYYYGFRSSFFYPYYPYYPVVIVSSGKVGSGRSRDFGYRRSDATRDGFGGRSAVGTTSPTPPAAGISGSRSGGSSRWEPSGERSRSGSTAAPSPSRNSSPESVGRSGSRSGSSGKESGSRSSGTSGGRRSEGSRRSNSSEVRGWTPPASGSSSPAPSYSPPSAPSAPSYSPAPSSSSAPSGRSGGEGSRSSGASRSNR